MEKKSELIIVMPTYNERANLEKLLPLISMTYKKRGITGGVIIVDDNSPDGTAKFLKRLIPDIYTKGFSVDLLLRQRKMGLGTAYIEGFNKALTKQTKYILGMDADFSHDPKYIPVILRGLRHNQVVIGSRYVPGGGIRNWSLFRRLLSRSASLFSRLVLGWKINDPTTSFVGFQKQALKDLNFAAIKTTGYAFLIEIKYLIHKANYSVKEIPIIFVDRAVGKSKLNKKIIITTVFNTLVLRFRYR